MYCIWEVLRCPQDVTRVPVIHPRNHSYCGVIKGLAERAAHSHFRVLALSATPGEDRDVRRPLCI